MRKSCDLKMAKFLDQIVLCISNHGEMLGGGEHSYLELLRSLPDPWKPIAVVPSHGKLETFLKASGIQTHIIKLPAIRPWTIKNIVVSIGQLISQFRRIRFDF